MPVTLTWNGDDLGFVWMTQPLPAFGEPIPDPARAAAALSLPPAAVAGTGLPVQVVSCGVPFLLVPLTTRSAVDSAAVNPGVLERPVQPTAKMPAARRAWSSRRSPVTRGRRCTAGCSRRRCGIAEDPATGSASGPLGCYLVRHKVVRPEKADAMLSLQGVKMGRPSHVHMSIGVENGDIASVRVGGESVLAGEGTLYL